jgi:hypothetical protein
MGRQKPTARAEFVLFDVVYEDGTISSNRKVPGSLLGGLDGDAPARITLEAQDREIAERSGRPRSRIKTVTRVDQRDATRGRSFKPAAQDRKPRI